MDKLKFLFLLYCYISFNTINAQVLNNTIGARSSAMGGCNVTFSDLWSTNNNQAGLGFIDEVSSGLYYENRFLLKELSYKTIAFIYPVKNGAIGVGLTSFGFELYNETKAGVSYGQQFGENFSIGVQLNYLRTNLTREYGNKNSLTGAIGLIAKLTNELTLGLHIYNPTRSKLAEYNNERIPNSMKMGLDYQLSKKVLMIIETEKDNGYKALIKMGLEYQIKDLYYLRMGLTTESLLNSFGFGLNIQDFKLEIASSYHQNLGLTPSISLIYVKPK